MLDSTLSPKRRRQPPDVFQSGCTTNKLRASRPPCEGLWRSFSQPLQSCGKLLMQLFALQAGLCATPAQHLAGGKAIRFPSASGTPDSVGFRVQNRGRAGRAPTLSSCWKSGCMPKHQHRPSCPSQPWKISRLAPDITTQRQARPCRSGCSTCLSGRPSARMHLKGRAHVHTSAPPTANNGARMHAPRVTTASGASTCSMCKHAHCCLGRFSRNRDAGPQACAPAPMPSLALIRGPSLRSKTFMRTDACWSRHFPTSTTGRERGGTQASVLVQLSKATRSKARVLRSGHLADVADVRRVRPVVKRGQDAFDDSWACWPTHTVHAWQQLLAVTPRRQARVQSWWQGRSIRRSAMQATCEGSGCLVCCLAGANTTHVRTVLHEKLACGMELMKASGPISDICGIRFLSTADSTNRGARPPLPRCPQPEPTCRRDAQQTQIRQGLPAASARLGVGAKHSRSGKTVRSRPEPTRPAPRTQHLAARLALCIRSAALKRKSHPGFWAIPTSFCVKTSSAGDDRLERLGCVSPACYIIGTEAGSMQLRYAAVQARLQTSSIY